MSETTSKPDRHLTWIFKSEKSLGILFILINAKVIRSLELLKSRKVSKNCAKIEFFTENVKKLDDVELRILYSPVFKPL